MLCVGNIQWSIKIILNECNNFGERERSGSIKRGGGGRGAISTWRSL